MDIDYDENDGSYAVHWENCIRGALYQTDAVVVIEEAAKCFGRLVRLYQSTLPRETIDAEIRDAIDTLGNKGTVPQHRRLAAVFILGELLRNVPNLVHLEVLCFPSFVVVNT